MKISFKKVKTEHTILPEFIDFLKLLESLESLQRLIPGRISRQQKGSSDLRFTISYPMRTGRKAKMSKGATSQELFIVTSRQDEAFKEEIEALWDHFTSSG